jgi:hypothetical protein
MKNLKTFEEFVNESAVINEGKYDNTYYEDILQAKFQDANWNRYIKGQPFNLFGPHPINAEQMEYEAERYNFSRKDTVPFQRNLLQNNMDPDKNWSQVPDKEISKYLTTWKKEIMEEVNNSVMITKIDKELERIFNQEGIIVHAHASTPDSLKIKFVRPIFTKYKNLKEALSFLQKTQKITVEASPTVVNKWEVEYDGTVENDLEEIIRFSNINNGLAVTLG